MKSLFAMFAVASGAVVPWIADSTLKGTVVLLIGAMAVCAMRQRSASIRHAVWVTAIAVVLLIPFCTTLLPGWHVIPSFIDKGPEAAPTEEEHQPPFKGNPSTTISTLNASTTVPANLGDESVGHSGAARNPVHTSDTAEVSYFQVAVLAWLIGSLMVFARIATGYFALRRLKDQSEILLRGRLCNLIDDVRRQLGIRSHVQLAISHNIKSPMAWGILRPCVCLPVSAKDWSNERTRAVLLHELGHIERRDPLTQILVHCACSLHWFNPLVWLAAWRTRVERERSCDDLVIRSGIDPADYAEHLLRIVSGFEGSDSAHATALAMANTTRLEDRLHRILGSKTNRDRLTPRSITLIVVTTLVISLPLVMLRAENRASTDEQTRKDDDNVRARVELYEKSFQAQIEVAELERKGHLVTAPDRQHYAFVKSNEKGIWELKLCNAKTGKVERQASFKEQFKSLEITTAGVAIRKADGSRHLLIILSSKSIDEPDEAGLLDMERKQHLDGSPGGWFYAYVVQNGEAAAIHLCDASTRKTIRLVEVGHNVKTLKFVEKGIVTIDENGTERLSVHLDEKATATAKPVEGIKARLAIDGGQSRIRHGEVVSFDIYVRNTTETTKTCYLPTIPKWQWTVDGYEITLAGIVQPFRQGGLIMEFKLGPNEEKRVSRKKARLLIQPDDWQGDKRQFNVGVLALPHGRYTVKTTNVLAANPALNRMSFLPAVMPAADFELEVVPDKTNRRRSTSRVVTADLVKIAWGETNRGLQAGIAWSTDDINNNRMDYPDIFIRNVSDMELTFEFIHPLFSPWRSFRLDKKEPEGPRLPGGIVTVANVTLQPGERKLIGTPTPPRYGMATGTLGEGIVGLEGELWFPDQEENDRAFRLKTGTLDLR